MQTLFSVQDYDLAETLTSGQAFRWQFHNGGWESVIENHWVRLSEVENGISAEVAEKISDWRWLENYLQLGIDLPGIIQSFPKDEPMQRAIEACSGLRLLRQNPWECLASFILSSTKQILQIRQIVALLCERFGEKIAVPVGYEPAFAFPTIAKIAALTEKDLRDCKMGFRAPFLLGSAEMLSGGEVKLETLPNFSGEKAREELLKLPGVGRKIADCVLLFAFGLPEAFPMDVWILKALQQLYFPKRRVKIKRLRKFSETYFGPNAGYAQQYLFHYMRTKNKVSRAGK